MTTVAQAADSIAYELSGAQRSEINVLSATMDASITTATFVYQLGGISEGAYIAIDDEVMYVFTAASGQATIRRGMLGTTPAAHDTGAIVTVNPSYPAGIVKQRMIEEIRSWPAGLFRVATETLTATGYSGDGRAKRTSRLTMTAPASQIGRILDVRQFRDTYGFGSFETWPRVRSWEWVTEREGADVSEIQVTEDLQGSSVWVAYTASFDLSTFTPQTDLETTVGIPDTALDILRMGVVMRMVPHREILRARTDAQGQPRDAAEVQPGQNSQSALIYKQLRDQRIAEEAHRLREKWPTVGG